MNGPHPSHVTRVSMDASTFDEICVNCGAHDEVPGGWGDLVSACTKSGDPYKTVEEYYKAMEARTECRS